MFFIIIFLLLAVYISYYGYEKKYLPITLSNFEYSTYKSHKNVPEGINSLTLAALIGQCPPGQCAIDIETGLKRCPENPTSKLTYNINEEACTRLNFCDYTEIPYAVRSDGSAFNKECEKSPDGENVPCRCTNKRTCADYQLSKFNILGGDPSKTTKNNFQIVQSTLKAQDLIGYSPIEIDNQSREFCEINPGFTGILTHGCDFINSVQDKLGCQTISNIVTSNLTVTIDWDLYKDVTLSPIQTEVVLVTQVSSQANLALPRTGMITFAAPSNSSGSATQTETVSYSGFSSITTDVVNNIQTITLYNIFSISVTQTGSVKNDGIPGKSGFQIAWKGRYGNTPTDTPSLTLAKNSFVFCSNLDTGPNYKNMLLCTQTDNNVCKFGNFTYNFDKLTGIKDNTLLSTDEQFTRNFCQLTPTNNSTLQRDNYLQDPEFYTLSCAIGSGCDGKKFQSNAIEESNAKYYPEVDIDGINGVWSLENITNFPYLHLKNPQGNIKVNGVSLGPTVLLNDQNLQAGDFWSIKVINQNLISGGTCTPANTSKIIVQDLFGLDTITNKGVLPTNSNLIPGISIGTDSYSLVSAEYGLCTATNQNQSSITIHPPLLSELGKFADIRLNPPPITTDDTYGIVVRDESGTNPGSCFTFMTLRGKTIPSFGDVNVDISLYKQFAFSGPNYMTNVSETVDTTIPSNNSNCRVYKRGNGENYNVSVIQASDKPKKFPMFPPENIYQLQFSTNKSTDFNLNYYSPQAPFKIPMSMYYPVWNPVLYQQECIRCKPLLLTFAELDSSNNLENVVIQFSGKDFGSYEYNTDPGADNNKYCHVTTSEINFDNTEGVINTTQRIMLKEPNLHVKIGDYVLDSTLQMPYKIHGVNVVSSSSVFFGAFFIAPQIFPSQDAIKYFTDNCLDKIKKDSNGYLNFPNPITYNPFTISYGLEESTSQNFIYNSDGNKNTLYCNQIGDITYDTGSKTWKMNNQGRVNKNVFSNNYFFGKKYTDLNDYIEFMKSPSPTGIPYTSGFYFIPLQKVTAISSDRKTVIVDSLFPKQILQRKTYTTGKEEPTYVQFCRLDSPLKLDVTTATGGVIKSEEVVINGMADSRITDIKITKSGSKFLQENLPIIKLNLENQKFL